MWKRVYILICLLKVKTNPVAVPVTKAKWPTLHGLRLGLRFLFVGSGWKFHTVCHEAYVTSARSLPPGSARQPCDHPAGNGPETCCLVLRVALSQGGEEGASALQGRGSRKEKGGLGGQRT